MGFEEVEEVGVVRSWGESEGWGKVKQIVGSTLLDSKEDGSALVTNFVSDKSAEEYAKMYEEDGLTGGHAIMLGAEPLSRAAAIEALHAYPGGSMVALLFL
ncbi:1-(5-phosphoribosyl)-5-[(5-phosphoribosylamino)methylideneamino] imidazole-4-carboxamide isomerase chloroplastic-like [Prunus yedoensis var. nudiflora]|uniref:1-(5-phosphoribosyl)-5-[(5-phosphoribosylamino)methylideneamino] imidazole-4-carboxamide isomerase chloroplastic-like n=1 Tax=Prunus yedoensis var. nudiflora TaxID=2094558 RepID=A0A314ZEX9_PRUYE|nr:1-(5-phosphoribosyl)-5-[(5-phosphoribosylamino)methylideneamino] imidazole-4-carboxamide isomerase chloroplastic-like [Prunus yedoensis var. nudiflora]